ncbi:MAG: exo-alpha-sialidase [Thermoguttaceae bacterium]|jgi:hypothetical protein|nr:exo-alpha-sialidase [Thermoguttaceae bacterium]
MNAKHNLFAAVLAALAVLALPTAGTAEENRSAGVERIRLLPPSEGNPRNSEGDFIALRDGRVLFAYSHFTGGGSDHAAAHIAGRYSSDGGRTWTDEDVMIVPREGDFNVMSVSLLRLQDGSIALFYLRKNSLVDCRPMMRLSRDEGHTWSDPIVCIAEVGYNVLNNDRAVQLANGRIILPVALHNTPAQNKFDGRGIISCHFSDDQGRTWRQSKTAQQGEKLTLQEPGVVQLKDDRLMMFCRTTHGSQYVSYSSDWGDTWTPFEPSNIISPCSPATIERIPATGDLLLVWNNHDGVAAEYRGKRTPLNVAISTDEGKTWEKIKTLEDDPHGWYCYIAVDFVGDHVLLGHCAGDRRTGGLNSTQITRFSLEWLYDRAGAFSLSLELRTRCVDILKQGLATIRPDMPKDEFWPAIHAAEGLTLAGHGDMVLEKLAPLLTSETDAQKRCGIAREMVRAGDRAKAAVMLDILSQEDAYGHVHAAESLFKVGEIGDGAAMRRAVTQADNLPLRVMAAAALAKCGDAEGLAVLRAILADRDSTANRLAAWAIGQVGNSSDIALLQKNLPHIEAPQVRCFYEMALANLGDPAGRKALVESLASEDPGRRVYAANFAGEARVFEAAGRLTELLDDPVPDVRYRAAQSLVMLAQPTVPKRAESAQ